MNNGSSSVQNFTPPRPHNDIGFEENIDEEDNLRSVLGLVSSSAFTLAIIGTCGNWLTILALTKSKKIKSSSKLYVIALAVVELCYCLFILPVNGVHYAYINYNNKQHFFSPTACIIFNVIRFTLSQAELQIILAIGITRAVAITFIEVHKIISRRNMILCHLGFIVLYSFALRLPIITELSGKYDYNENSFKCGLGPDSSSLSYRKVAMMLETILPICLILLSYIYIFIKLKISAHQFRRSSEDTSASAKSIESLNETEHHQGRRASDFRRDKRNITYELTRAIFIIYLILILCNVPIITIHTIQSLSKGKIYYPKLFLLFHITYWMHFCLNTFVYVLCNRQYRYAYMEVIMKKFPKLFKDDEVITGTPRRPTINVSSDEHPEGLEQHENSWVEFQPHDLSVIPEARTSEMTSSDVYK